MKVNRVFLVVTAAVISVVAVPSCTYSPYSSTPSYSSGYGHGHGYGSRTFTTTYFVRTSNSRWGYDPYARCYYDYTRRCYYDPYLNGYYPAGYRPVYVYGTPHPHGWRTGHSHIAPPRYIHNHNLNNYNNRYDQYRSLNTDWSRNIKPTTSSRIQDSKHYDRHSSVNQSRQNGNDSMIRSSQDNQVKQSENRKHNSYVNTNLDRSHSNPKLSEPRRDSPNSSNKEKVKKEDRNSPSHQQSKPKNERSGRISEVDNSGAMRQPVERSNNREKNQEDRHSEPSERKNSEAVVRQVKKKG
jgi:hypothetical protein